MTTATIPLAEGCHYQRGAEARTVARLWDMPTSAGRQPMVDYRDDAGVTRRCTEREFRAWLREE